jgi:5-methyltetrahydropteroyltriglutamate--homocysteine methyltransferase
MCGVLSEKGDTQHELTFATDLVNQVTAGLPRERLALHVCRGNWTRDEGAALSGDYGPLLPVFERLTVGTLLLETSTPRAGDLALLKDIPATIRLGVGVVNQKHDRVEPVAEIVARARRAIDLVGAERVWLTPDCGFATFADNPVASARVAEAKLRAIAQAAAELRGVRL